MKKTEAQEASLFGAEENAGRQCKIGADNMRAFQQLGKLGRDVGYGLGWKLQAGSLAPYWTGYWALHHWTFTDATGAEYRLDVNANGVWTSR